MSRLVKSCMMRPPTRKVSRKKNAAAEQSSLILFLVAARAATRNDLQVRLFALASYAARCCRSKIFALVSRDVFAQKTFGSVSALERTAWRAPSSQLAAGGWWCAQPQHSTPVLVIFAFTAINMHAQRQRASERASDIAQHAHEKVRAKSPDFCMSLPRVRVDAKKGRRFF